MPPRANSDLPRSGIPDMVTTAEAAGLLTGRGLTTAEVAQRYRVGEDRVRGWIKSGALRAVNTADANCGKPRFVVPPEALAEFERVRSAAAPPPKPQSARRRPSGQRDFFPD